MALNPLDIAIVATSVAVVVLCGIYYSLGKQERHPPTAHNYFLAGRCMPYYIVAASLFAANVGSEQFVGMAGTAAKSGIAVAMYELSAPYLLLLLGWIFAPLYIHCNIRTTPEYLEQRFNKICRFVFVTILIATHILATISATLYAGSVVLEVVTGLSIWQSTPLIVCLTALYTTIGGLKAVMITDAIQSIILLTGGAVGSLVSLHLVGGIGGLFAKLEAVQLESFRHLIRPLNDRDFPWLGTWLALFIGGMRCWCLDQEMAQRVLSAKNLHHARLGTAGAALLKLLPLFIIGTTHRGTSSPHDITPVVLPGMVARVLFEWCRADVSGEAFPAWCSTALDSSHEANKAYPLLVLHEFPHGVKGLMIASFLAAMMSSLSSLFNSVSAMFTYDIYGRCLCHTGEALSAREVTRVGRMAVMGLVALTLLWIPVIDASNRSLFIMASEVVAHLGPSITAVFVCGVFLRRVNSEGAVIGLSVGSLVGAIRLIFFLVYQDTCDLQVHSDNRQTLTWANGFFCLNFHYFSPILFALTVGMIIVASLYYPPPLADQTEGRVISWRLLTETTSPSNLPRYVQLASTSERENNTKSVSITVAATKTIFLSVYSKKKVSDAYEEQGRETSVPSVTASTTAAIIWPILVFVSTTGVIYYFR